MKRDAKRTYTVSVVARGPRRFVAAVREVEASRSSKWVAVIHLAAVAVLLIAVLLGQ